MIVGIRFVLLPLIKRRPAHHDDPFALRKRRRLRCQRQDRQCANEENPFHAQSRGGTNYAGEQNAQVVAAAVSGGSLPDADIGSYNAGAAFSSRTRSSQLWRFRIRLNLSPRTRTSAGKGRAL